MAPPLRRRATAPPSARSSSRVAGPALEDRLGRASTWRPTATRRVRAAPLRERRGLGWSTRRGSLALAAVAATPARPPSTSRAGSATHRDAAPCSRSADRSARRGHETVPTGDLGSHRGSRGRPRLATTCPAVARDRAPRRNAPTWRSCSRSTSGRGRVRSVDLGASSRASPRSALAGILMVALVRPERVTGSAIVPASRRGRRRGARLDRGRHRCRARPAAGSGRRSRRLRRARSAGRRACRLRGRQRRTDRAAPCGRRLGRPRSRPRSALDAPRMTTRPLGRAADRRPLRSAVRRSTPARRTWPGAEAASARSGVAVATPSAQRSATLHRRRPAPRRRGPRHPSGERTLASASRRAGGTSPQSRRARLAALAGAAPRVAPSA